MEDSNMRIEDRIRKLEECICPAPIVPVHVMIVMPGCRKGGEKVYREDQFPAGFFPRHRSSFGSIQGSIFSAGIR